MHFLLKYRVTVTVNVNGVAHAEWKQPGTSTNFRLANSVMTLFCSTSTRRTCWTLFVITYSRSHFSYNIEHKLGPKWYILYTQECIVYNIDSGQHVIFRSNWSYSNFLFLSCYRPSNCNNLCNIDLLGISFIFTSPILPPWTLSLWCLIKSDRNHFAFTNTSTLQLSAPDEGEEVVSTSYSSSHQASRPSCHLPLCTSMCCRWRTPMLELVACKALPEARSVGQGL